MSVDEAWPEATYLSPERTGKLGVEMRSCWHLYDVNVSLAQRFHEATAVLGCRHTHPHLNAGVTKAGKERK
jgi:hypothetical protein